MIFNLFKKKANPQKELFLKALSQLLYSIASADKVVTNEELEAIENLLHSEWQAKNILKNGEINLIILEVKALVKAKANSNASFEDFKNYFENSNSDFSPTVKNLIWKTSDTIASAYAGKNKSEVILLAKLKSLLLDTP